MVTGGNLLGLKRRGAARATDNQVGLGHGLLHAALGHRENIALGGELGGASGTGVHPDVGAAAVAQGRNRGARVGAGAEHQGAAGGPILLGHLVGQIQGHGDDGASLRAQEGVLADLAGRVRGVFEELNQLAGQGALIPLRLLLGGGEGAAYLAGNLALAHDGGLQAGGDRQQVADGVLVLVQVEAAGDECRVQPGPTGDAGGNHVADGGQVRGNGELDVHLEAVAGGQDHRAGHAQLTGVVAREDVGYARGTGAQGGDGG